MFGSSVGKYDQAVWQQFSDENHGFFVKGESYKLDRVNIDYRNHTISFDRYIVYQVVGWDSFDTEFTRVRVECKTPNDLRFRLTKQGFVDTIGELFAVQDIQVGAPDFDNRFLIKGNDEFTIQGIFSNEKLRQLLLRQSDVVLHLLDNEGVFNEPIRKGYAMVYYVSETVVKEKEQLDSLLETFQTLIDQLLRMNSIKTLEAVD